MKTVLRAAAGLLALLLTAGCGAVQPVPMSDPADNGPVAYVPLDDRPDNVERVVYLAESLGYTLRMPDGDLYATRLDGQPRNANGTQSGDRAALYEWVLAQEAAGCDRYILSLDQLLSGGLVNSRHAGAALDPVTLSDGTVLTEYRLAERLLAALSADENNRVWLLDTVMRLAPTVGYSGLGLNEYNALRDYGMAPRPELSGDALTVENITADYALGADGAPLAVQSEEPLPPGAAERYLASRARKLTLSGQVQSLLRGGASGLSVPSPGRFHLLIGIDDSSAEDSIQKNEIAYLRQNLREGDAVLSGVDDLAFKAVAQLYFDETGFQCSAAVAYYGGLEHQAACAYDYQPLEAIVDEHLDFFGVTRADASEADVQILVLTQPAEPEQKEAYCQALIDRLQENAQARRPTILIDAANDAYGTAFHDALVKRYDLTQLLSYAGFLDMAIVTGTALSHGLARYAWLVHTESPLDPRANEAFVRTLADSVIKDFCYRNTLRNELYAYVRDQLGGSPDNFYQPEIDRSAVLKRLEDGMAENTKAVLKNFASGNVPVALDPYTEIGCGQLTLSGYGFPWSRVFEFHMEIGLAPFTTPRRGLLGS